MKLSTFYKSTYLINKYRKGTKLDPKDLFKNLKYYSECRMQHYKILTLLKKNNLVSFEKDESNRIGSITLNKEWFKLSQNVFEILEYDFMHDKTIKNFNKKTGKKEVRL